MKRLKIIIFVAIALLSVCAQSQTVDQGLATTHMITAFAQYNNGDYQNALTGFLETGKMLENDTSKLNREVYVRTQSMAVLCYVKLKLYNDAFKLSEQLLKGSLTDQERAGLQHLYVTNGYLVAGTYMNQNMQRYPDSRELLKKILPFADDVMRGNILSRIPLTWYFEGGQFQIRQQFDLALPCMLEARNGFYEINDTINVINTCSNIGSILENSYDILGALESYGEAYHLAKKVRNEKKLMEILSELLKLTNLIGDSERAYRYDMEMDSIVSVTSDINAKVEYNFHRGYQAYKNGAFDAAIQYYKMNERYLQSLDQDNYLAERHRVNSSLRDVYDSSGRYDLALEYAHKSKQDLEHYSYGKFFQYQAIANIYRHKKDSINCFLYLDSLFQALNTLEEPREIALLYSSRASCEAAFHNYETAFADSREADRILATKYNETDEDRITLLTLMGGIENKLMHYDASEHLYRKYAELVKAQFGEKSINYINALNFLANAEGFAGHIESSCDDYARSVDLAKTYIHKRMPYLTTEERQGFWKPLSEMMCNMTPFAIKAGQLQSPFTESCYDGLLLSKGFLLSSERSTFDLIESQGTESELKDYAAIVSMMAQVKELENDYSANADRILSLTNKINHLEKVLMDSCRSYGNMASFMSIDYKRIREDLGEKDVIIDFTDYVTASRGRVYAAYFINRNQDHPLLKELFTETVIDSMRVPYINKYYEEPYASRLYHLLWEPFSDYIDEGATVYYVPSQFLFQLALESLPLEDGTLLGDHYNFIRLSSAREIVKVNPMLNVNEKVNPSAVLYGGLEYDISNDRMKQESSKYGNLSVPYYAQRREVERGDSIFKELLWTKVEVERIGKLLSAQQILTKPYIGAMGTEESFMALSGRAPSILHIATHGFYFSPTDAKDVDFLKGYQDAMMLSGLVMAGGNAEWRGRTVPNGVMGGILTAEDISRLDLNGVEIAVLSACQTGQGKATSEGLYGLQRAFKKAGVQTLIMSLWNVSDKVSSEFMIEFYKQLVNPKNQKTRWDKRKAFAEAKRLIRKKHDDPYYWAPFIMLD